MKTSILLFVNLFLCINLFAQINSNSPTVPFGSRSSYPNGIMPTVLPTSGTYTKSQDAADAYNAWKALVQDCTDGSRVLFDDGASTVSEGIAYGMLLSAYAGDKPLFDNLWKYYKAHSNSNGIMNWKYSNCDTKAGDNGATDAEEDAALALIIAEEQWPTATSPYDYKAEATTLIGKIREFEIHNTSFQVLNGDAWGSTNTCRNPSYMAPAYFREYAKIETSQSAFWNSVTSSAESFLLTNRNATTGLVCNWADKDANSSNCNGTQEFGWDAIRNPWRMATDVLWNGTATATTGADICSKMSNWANNYAANLKGPCAQNASNPSVGSYKNGTFSMMGLAFMGTTGTTYQSALNTAYTSTVGLGNSETYYSRTLRCITLFMMTGNFWQPGASGIAVAPTVVSATTSSDGLIVTVTFDQAIALNGTAPTAFTLKIGGTISAGAITALAMNGTNAIDLTIESGKILPGNIVTINYTAGTIKSTAIGSPSLASFTNKAVTNALSGNSTLIDDCEDNNSINNLGGKWFTYTDKADGGLSTITPTTTATVLFPMEAGGGANTTGYYAKTTYTLSKGTLLYDPYVGLGTYSNSDTTKTADWSSGTGISFWYKGGACDFKVLTKLPSGKTEDYAYYFYSITPSATWKKVTIPWASFAKPSWATTASRSTFDRTVIEKLQWQITTTTGTTGEISVDDITIDGMLPPVKATSIVVTPATKEIYVVDIAVLTASILPATTTNKTVIWTSSNSAIAAVDASGIVYGLGAGTATITATATDGSGVYGTCVVTILPLTLPDPTITLSPTQANLEVSETLALQTLVTPTDMTEITYTSSNPLVATVNPNGVVTAIGAGTAIITAKPVGATITATSIITVTQPITEISIVPQNATLDIQAVIGLTAVVFPVTATNKNIYWTSSNPSVATVSQTGLVTAIAEGTVTISANSADGSGKVGTSVITVKPAPVVCNQIQVFSNITNVYCSGAKTGEIELLVSGGVEPYTYKWSNTGTENTILGLQAGTYSVTITDDEGCSVVKVYEVTQPNALELTPTIVSPQCGNSDGSISVQISGGTSPYTFAWSDASITNAITAKEAGLYTVTATDNKGCEIEETYELSNDGAPEITVESVVPTNCNASTGGIYISVTGGTEPYSYAWNDSNTDEDRIDVSPGIYTITVTDDNGCKSIASAEVESSSIIEPSIALVTVSVDNGKNQIVWQKETTDLIDFYTIYRENNVAGQYDVIGTVPYIETSVFEDPTANSQVRAWRYKISATDVCGNESELSTEHKTLHLQKNIGLGNVVNLDWTGYEGIYYATYNIYRINTSDVVELIDQVPSSISNYTDLTPPANVKSYYVAIVLPNEIDANEALLKLETGPFTLALSNIAEVQTGIAEVENGVKVYPTLVEGVINVELGDLEGATVSLVTANGETVYVKQVTESTIQIPTTNFAKGAYNVVIQNNITIFTLPIIIK